MRGWVIDAQVSQTGDLMDVWIFKEDRVMELVSIPWSPHIHVYGSQRDLNSLNNWLMLAEISNRFSVGATRFVKKRLSLDEYEMHDVLEINVLDSRNLRKLAEHIESKGSYSKYDLYSIDAHLAQRFFIELSLIHI